jgi:RNA polymerase sigma factor (TIGR02999 family)
MGDITVWIQAARRGEPEAVGQLFELLYPQLRQIAHAKLRPNGAPEGANTTQIVHECFLRLAKLERLRVEDRSHFLAYAARVMRSVVVDLVREARAERRGGHLHWVTLDTEADAAAGDDEALRVHEALLELEAIDERLVRVVELRYYVGLQLDEIAEVLGVGKRTVERDWEKARLFLYSSLGHH